MLAPGKYYPETTLQIEVSFTDEDGVAVDPSTVTFETMSPCWVRQTYVYGTDNEITKPATGNYVAEISPGEAGRWNYRWVTTGSGTALVTEGDFLIQDSRFVTWPLNPDYI